MIHAFLFVTGSREVSVGITRGDLAGQSHFGATSYLTSLAIHMMQQEYCQFKCIVAKSPGLAGKSRFSMGSPTKLTTVLMIFTTVLMIFISGCDQLG